MEQEGYMVPRLRELLKEWGVRGYSRKRRGELLENLQVSELQPAPPPLTWEPMRPLPPSLSVRFRPDRLGPRQPSSREMDIFEQQEMSKSRSQVRDNLKE